MTPFKTGMKPTSPKDSEKFDLQVRRTYGPFRLLALMLCVFFLFWVMGIGVAILFGVVK